MKRYTIVVTDDMWGSINNIAKHRGINVIDVIRRFLSLGIYFWNHRECQIIMRDTRGNEKEIVILD